MVSETEQEVEEPSEADQVEGIGIIIFIIISIINIIISTLIINMIMPILREEIQKTRGRIGLVVGRND